MSIIIDRARSLSIAVYQARRGRPYLRAYQKFLASQEFLRTEPEYAPISDGRERIRADTSISIARHADRSVATIAEVVLQDAIGRGADVWGDVRAVVPV